MTPKERAAQAALDYVRDGMVVGLGTGSTAECFLQALARALHAGRLRNVTGVATSVHSERQAAELGIPVATLMRYPHPDLTVDGADEVTPTLDLIKGLGGALLREKIVAQNSKRFLIVADASKAVERLGTRSALPVEVAPFAHECQEEFLRTLGASPALRRTADGAIYSTDNGNVIYDCRFNGIADPRALENALNRRAGIVDTGLFLGMADVALLADDQRVEVRMRGKG